MPISLVFCRVRFVAHGRIVALLETSPQNIALKRQLQNFRSQIF